MDQVLFCPSFLVVWLVGLWKLEELDPNHSMTEQNKPRQTYMRRLVDAVPNLVVANWILWFPAQAINFGFVPVKFQVLFSNFVSLLWNGYLSFSTSSTAGAKMTEGLASRGNRVESNRTARQKLQDFSFLNSQLKKSAHTVSNRSDGDSTSNVAGAYCIGLCDRSYEGTLQMQADRKLPSYFVSDNHRNAFLPRSHFYQLGER